MGACDVERGGNVFVVEAVKWMSTCSASSVVRSSVVVCLLKNGVALCWRRRGVDETTLSWEVYA